MRESGGATSTVLRTCGGLMDNFPGMAGRGSARRKVRKGHGIGRGNEPKFLRARIKRTIFERWPVASKRWTAISVRNRQATPATIRDRGVRAYAQLRCSAAMFTTNCSYCNRYGRHCRDQFL